MCLGNNKPNSMAMARSSKLSNIRSILLAANCQNSTVKQKCWEICRIALSTPKRMKKVFKTFVLHAITAHLHFLHLHSTWTTVYTRQQSVHKPQLLSTRWVCPLYKMMNDPLLFLTPNSLTLSSFSLVSESMSPSVSPSSMKTIVWTLCFKDGPAT